MTQTLIVRRSRPADAASLHAIALSIVTAYGLSPDPDLLTFGVPPRRLVIELVAENGEQGIAGTITLSRHPHGKNAGWVSKFFVDPLARGSGAGRALLDAVIAEAEKLGMEWLELSTLEVFHAAIHLYESTGWKRRKLRGAGMERRYVRTLPPRD